MKLGRIISEIFVYVSVNFGIDYFKTDEVMAVFHFQNPVILNLDNP